MTKKLGFYTLVDRGLTGVNVYDCNGICCGSIDNITIDDISNDEEVKDLLFGDIDCEYYDVLF